MNTHKNSPLEHTPFAMRAHDLVTRHPIVGMTARDAHDMIAKLTEEFALDEFNADMD